MLPTFHNPALEWLTKSFRDELLIAEVFVRRNGNHYELTHIADRGVAQLRDAKPAEARAIAQFTEQGEFRPLKSAPSLRRGWRILAHSDAELATALDQLYPGFVADFYSARNALAVPTDYGPFTERQTGMYRITSFLKEADAAAVVQKCCAPIYCLKCRLWDVSGHAPESPQQKSVIPCFEPCAILLEFARKTVRAMQRENATTMDVLRNLEPLPKGDGAAE